MYLSPWQPGDQMATRHQCVLFFVFAFVLVVFFLLQYLLNSGGELTTSNYSTLLEADPNRKTWVINDDDDLDHVNIYSNSTDGPLKHPQKVPDILTKLSKCPACFGRDICEEIDNGIIQIDVPTEWTFTKDKGVYFGRRHGTEKIVVKTLVRDKVFKKFDSFICQNVTGTSECDVGDAIARSYVVNENTWTGTHLQESWKIVHPFPQLFTMCMNQNQLRMYTQLFHGSHATSADTRAMLYTASVINTEAVNLKILSILKVKQYFPRYLGARTIVAGHGGIDLMEFIKDDWETRADLALQLLNMVEDFLEGDPNWVILFVDFIMAQFRVKANGKVLLIDAEDIGIIDRRYVQKYGRHKPNAPCNIECFTAFANYLINGTSTTRQEHDQWCAETLHVVGSAMKALVCSRILSNIPQHKVNDTFDTKKHHSHDETGLLHSIPVEVERTESLLRECVVETSAGGRDKAFKELQLVLIPYAKHSKRAILLEVHQRSFSHADVFP